MNSQVFYLEAVFLGNSLRAWIVALAIMAAIVILARIAKAIVARRISVRGTGTALHDLIAALLLRIRFLLILVIAIFLASFSLELPESGVRVLRTLAVIALLVQGAFWGSAVISFWLARHLAQRGDIDAASRTTLSTIGFVGHVVLWATLLLLALDNLGVRVTGLVTGLGIGGVAVALAAQEVLKDLFASLAIALDKPFLLGDAITVGEFGGTVEHIGIKTTRLRSATGEELIFSNSDILNSRIRNYQRMQQRSVVSTVRLGYETPADKVSAVPGIIREILEGQQKVHFDRAHFRSFGEASLEFEYAYTLGSTDYLEYMNTQQAINLAIMKRFHETGIRLALPSRSLIVQGTLSCEKGKADS